MKLDRTVSLPAFLNHCSQFSAPLFIMLTPVAKFLITMAISKWNQIRVIVHELAEDYHHRFKRHHLLALRYFRMISFLINFIYIDQFQFMNN